MADINNRFLSFRSSLPSHLSSVCIGATFQDWQFDKQRLISCGEGDKVDLFFFYSALNYFCLCQQPATLWMPLRSDCPTACSCVPLLCDGRLFLPSLTEAFQNNYKHFCHVWTLLVSSIPQHTKCFMWYFPLIHCILLYSFISSDISVDVFFTKSPWQTFSLWMITARNIPPKM